MDKKAPSSTGAIHDTPDNPVPGNATSGFFETNDGKRLRYALFRSSVTRAKGTIVLLQGRNETIEKYYETIRDLTEAGLWVATFDWRGQGGSERLLQGSDAGHIRRFSDYESDLEFFLENIVLPDTRLPFYIVGHSTGGLIALSAAPRLANRVERMVLTSPFVGMHPGRYDTAALRLFVRAASLLGFGRRSATGSRQRNLNFEDNALTSDRARFNRNRAIYDVCPDFILGGPTFRWLAESFRTMKRVHNPAHLASIRIPTLIFGAGADSIVPIQEIEQIASHFRASELITVDHARHELFQEADIFREQVLAGITAFLPGEA